MNESGLVHVTLDERSLPHDLLLLRASTAECLTRGRGSVVVDISSLRRLSSETIAALLWTRRKCSGLGIGFTIVGARAAAAQSLSRCGMAEQLTVGGG
ncbi:STAS domain-containing protein [Intrasporangium calvum]|uniref:STAS domain-containing protein n=1 Tax=Intrasporangium calvum TaxID=53358 RepID=UPI000319E89C|nr:STAS domain-containing protein [Intrasporangium calvum]